MSIITHPFVSPLRYPGGKGVLASFVKRVLEENFLCDGTYIEVYGGSASIAWSLLIEEYVRRVYVNDISRPIYALWSTVLDQTDELCRLVLDTPVTVGVWRRQRAIQFSAVRHSALELGFSTLFLNRTNRSGIIGGGIIGGQSQSGRWKIDARFNKPDLVARIQRIAQYRDRIHLHRSDGAQFIQTILPRITGKALVYLDPPYYAKGKHLYQDFYEHGDHLAISRLVQSSITQPWIVTYDAVPDIMRMYRERRRLEYTLSYSAQSRYRGSEVMFFSNELSIPRAGVSTAMRRELSATHFPIDQSGTYA